MVGERFGRLTIVSEASRGSRNRRRMLCQCDCGATTTVTVDHLRSGHTKSCGCLLRAERRPTVLGPGDRFERLTVRECIGKNRHGQRLWLCDCDCGAVHVATATSLLQKRVRSCGCLRAERLAEANIKHGAANVVRGGRLIRAETPEYRAWESMKRRCYNSRQRNYADYGGRGITVCDRWLNDFPAFYADMGPKPSPQHSLDRIDVNGNYEPSNCRWATAKEQRANQRR